MKVDAQLKPYSFVHYPLKYAYTRRELYKKQNVEKFRTATELYGGEGGIRTLGTLLAYTHFPGVLLRPLGHLSSDTECPRRAAG